MKALAIDCASSKTVVAAENNGERATITLEIGAKQSQQLLPAIDYALRAVGLCAQNLDFTALTKGPGTFTGLRIAFSALKAIELAHNVPIYGVSSLQVYAFPFFEDEIFLVPVIDAKKNQFFASVYFGKNEIFAESDTDANKIADFLKKSVKDDKQKILIVGSDAQIFSDELKKFAPNLNFQTPKFQNATTDSIFKIASEQFLQKKEPLKDYDGPLYLRKSEAELSLEKPASLS